VSSCNLANWKYYVPPYENYSLMLIRSVSSAPVITTATDCIRVHKRTICDQPDSNQELSNPHQLHPTVTESNTEPLGRFHKMSLLLCPRARQLSLDVHAYEDFLYDKSGAIWDTIKRTFL